MLRLLGLIRLLAFLMFTTILVIVVVLAGVVLGTNIRRSMRLRRHWARLMIKVLGAKLKFRGEVPPEAGLIVSNHRSYFDFVPLFCHILAYPVGKIQIDNWPLVGFSARQTGVIFVDREDKQHRKTTLNTIREKIAEGFFVINYAEGTTHKQPVTLPFKSGAFYMAAQEGFLVYPVAVDYKNIDDAWVDDDTFVRHFLECFGKPTSEVKVSFGAPLSGNNPRLLLAQSQSWIDDQLIQFREEWSTV